jgi:acetylornithine deacetylase/succinyl-diaminopimelate desuccinylase-like protein
MAAELVDLIASICAPLGFKHRIIPSGATHDAVNFAGLVPTGMIFIPSKDGVSHHPDEFSEPRAVVAGAQVLFETIRLLL